LMKDYHSRKIRNRRGWYQGKKLFALATMKRFFLLAIRTTFCLSIILVASVSLHFLINFTIQSSCLEIKDTQFEGCQNVSPQELMTLAGLRPGANIFTVSLKEISQRIRANPWVKEVKIRRTFPHLLTVKVNERVPVALVSHKKLFLVDEEGILFKEVEANDKVNMPIITGLSFSQQNSDRLKRIIDLLKLADKEAVLPMEMVSEVHFDANYGITIYTLQDAIPIRMGFGDYGKKLALLATIQEDLYARQVTPEAIDIISSETAHVKKLSSSQMKINTCERG